MLLMLLQSLVSVCTLLVSVPLRVSAVATETVVGMAGEGVRLPCRVEEVRQSGLDVCWGRGKPSLFNCHNTVINAAGDQVTYQQSHRFSVSSSRSALFISKSQLSDAGFYHCRVQLPGLFNDKISTIHLIIIRVKTVTSKHPRNDKVERFNMPLSVTGFVTEKRGSYVTAGTGTEPMVALVQSQTQEEPMNTLQFFVGSTLRMAFVIFIPAVLLTAAYKISQSKQKEKPEQRSDQSMEEDISSV